ncbi:MAG: hypothetical protein ACRDNR_12360 [Gaiellaceae bacterium]
MLLTITTTHRPATDLGHLPGSRSIASNPRTGGRAPGRRAGVVVARRQARR